MFKRGKILNKKHKNIPWIICIVIILGMLFLGLTFNNNETFENELNSTYLLNQKKWEKSLKEKKYFITVAAIFKNENDYLEEWLDFYVKQNIDQFYMFDNNDNAEYDKITNKIFDKYKGKITHIKWNNIKTEGGLTVQRKAYQYCYDKYNHEFQWMMMSDIDEFAYSIQPNKTLKDILMEYANPDTPYIKVPRFNYGNSGYIKKPEGGVVKNYVKREKNISSYKSITNADYVDKRYHSMGVHRLLYKTKKNMINQGIKIACNLPEDYNKIPLVMNHYYTKSHQEYVNKCMMWSQNPINFLGKRTNDCYNKKIFDEKNDNSVLDTRAKDLFVK